MDKGSIYGPLGIVTKVILKTIKDMVKVLWNGLTELFIKDNGKMEFKMDPENWIIKMALCKKEFLKTTL